MGEDKGIKLDYGSGRKARKGFLTSDFTGSPRYNYIIEDYKIKDIEEGTVRVLHCRNVLHHIKLEDLPVLFKEFERMLCKKGKLIISEPREEYFYQNKILDLIWYRFLYYDTEIYIPHEYENFRDKMDKSVFELKIKLVEDKNDIFIFQKR